MTVRDRPFVLLHGFTGTSRSFDALKLEGAQAPLLAGHGPDPDLSSHNFDEEVDRLARSIKRLGRRVSLVGYSMGARVALGLCLAHRDLVDRATLIGVNPGLKDQSEREDRVAWETGWQDILDVDGLALFEHKWRTQPLFASQASLPPHALEEQKQQRLSHTARGLSHALDVLGLGSMPNLWPQIETLTLSLQIVVGEHDQKFRAIAAKMVAANSRVAVFEIGGVGHNPLLEAPEQLRDLILSSAL